MSEGPDDDDGTNDLDFIPYPTITEPPDPADLGQFLSSFGCWLVKATFDKHGAIMLTFRVDHADKYAALPLTDVAGKKFTALIHAPSEWQPVVESGVLRIQKVRASRKQKMEQRRVAREWRRVAHLFHGQNQEPVDE
jgi:hypothetical protein